MARLVTFSVHPARCNEPRSVSCSSSSADVAASFVRRSDSRASGVEEAPAGVEDGMLEGFGGVHAADEPSGYEDLSRNVKI